MSCSRRRRTTSFTSRRHSHVETAIAPDLPAVEGDAVLLRRALDNLLENARKHSPPGSVLEVRALRRGDDAVVQLVDHGEGIAPEDLKRLFTPFFRTDRSRTRHTGGVGLGLTLTRRIVEAHAGSIEAESTPGVGTTMTITLPGTPSAAPVA
jgi:signal transduction histidine kinase